MKKTVISIALILLLGSLWAKGTVETSTGGKVSSEQAKSLVSSGAVLLDVRTEDEFNDFHIPGAVLLPYDKISAISAASIIPTFDAPVVVYCRSGRRSDIALKTLLSLGYTEVRDLGSITNWKE